MSNELAAFQLGTVKVLLVEDDEEDYMLTRDLLRDLPGQRFALTWASTFEKGLEQVEKGAHDVVLVDYRLGAGNGVEFIREATRRGCQAPFILLTGASQHQVDLEAMRAGADDYLIKAELQARTLERSIRYAIQRRRSAAEAAFEQARLAAFGAEIGLALTRRDSLDALLERCAKTMAQYLSPDLAVIWVFDARKKALQARALGGSLAEGGAFGGGAPDLHIDPVALARGEPLFVANLREDARFSGTQPAREHGLQSLAVCPLILEDTLVGAMAVLSRESLREQVLQEMGSVANGIALCIQRKRSEEALDRSEVRYRSVVENIKEVIFQMDQFGNWTFLNPAWTSVTGFECGATLGTFFLEYVCREDQEQNRHIFLQLVQRKIEFCRYETRMLTRQGQVRWVEVYLQLTPSSETGLGISGTLTDITERKQAEVQIQKLAAFPQVNPNPVLEFSAEGVMTYMNDAARAVAAQMGQSDPAKILPANTPEVVRQCLADGQKRLREEVRVEGRTLVWSFFPVPVSQVVHCYGADVTEMLNLEAQFRHAQKLESVGQLAAGVAHDFNNILTVIQGYSESLLARCRGDAQTTAALKQVSNASQRAASLTRQLLMFSRKQVIQPRVLDLNAVLQNLASMLLRLLGEDIVLQASYASNLPCIEADTGMMEQVVMNLAVNARDAMPKGGVLEIGTTVVDIGQAYVERRADARVGRFVKLTVRDTGCGMDEGTRSRIFEPFFSTKEVGKGTGLGLATVHGVVKQHQGWIAVETAVGKGTTFEIYLPALEVAKPASEDERSGTQFIRGGKESVLVVEDEPVLRELVREVLQGYQYRVIEASSGVEALRIWDEFNGEVDLLLTDLVMPEGMSGTELAAQLRSRKPELKVVFTSGYSPEVMGPELDQAGSYFLSKPYQTQQLAKIVRQALDGVDRREKMSECGAR